MRSSSAYLPAIVTAAVVLVALGLLVSVTGTLLPFGDWDRGVRDEASTVIHAPPPRDLSRQGALAAAPAATAARPAAARPAKARPPAGVGPAKRERVARVRRAPVRPTAPRARRPQAPPVPRPVASPEPEPAPAPQQARPEPEAAAPPPASPGDGGRPVAAHRITDVVGDATRSLAEQAGTTLGRLHPGLGNTVADTGRGLGDVVSGLGGPPQP